MDLLKNWDWEQKPVSCSEIIEILLWQSLKKLIHTLYSQSFSSKQKTSTSVPKSPLLFNSPSPATSQKPLPSIRHICGLGASVGCERVERTFNTPRLKAQICLIEGNGFVCSLLNELNSKYILNIWRERSIMELIWFFGKVTVFYPFTARRLRPLRWEMNCVCYLLDSAS